MTGGVAFEVRTTAPSDFVTSWGHKGGYILSARDLITNDIEAQVEGALLDGMVCLASCDKTPPGQLMAAGRLNIPTLVFCCGYQPSGRYKGQVCDIEDVFATAGGLAFGKVSIDEIKAMGDVAILGPGVCAGRPSHSTERSDGRFSSNPLHQMQIHFSGSGEAIAARLRPAMPQLRSSDLF